MVRLDKRSGTWARVWHEGCLRSVLLVGREPIDGEYVGIGVGGWEIMEADMFTSGVDRRWVGYRARYFAEGEVVRVAA